MSDRKLDTHIRREQIAEAALQLVAAHGLRRLSIAAVARRVGLVPSGIYRHFRNKAEIVDALLDRVEERLLGNVDAAQSAHRSPLACLRDVLMRHVAFIREGRAIPRIVFSDELHSGQPQLKARILRIFQTYAGRLHELIRKGQACGEIRDDADPALLAMMIFGIVMPAGVLWHVTEGGFDVTRHATRAWKLFCEMAAPKPRTDQGVQEVNMNSQSTTHVS